MNFQYGGTENVEYECNNITIIDGNAMDVYLVINEGNYGAIDADDSAWRGCYIIIFSSSPYTV